MRQTGLQRRHALCEGRVCHERLAPAAVVPLARQPDYVRDDVGKSDEVEIEALGGIELLGHPGRWGSGSSGLLLPSTCPVWLVLLLLRPLWAERMSKCRRRRGRCLMLGRSGGGGMCGIGGPGKRTLLHLLSSEAKLRFLNALSSI